MNFKPITSAAITGATFGHAHEETLAQSAGFTRGSILLVDHTFAVVLALGNGAQVVVGASEERLHTNKCLLAFQKH